MRDQSLSPALLTAMLFHRGCGWVGEEAQGGFNGFQCYRVPLYEAGALGWPRQTATRANSLPSSTKCVWGGGLRIPVTDC